MRKYDNIILKRGIKSHIMKTSGYKSDTITKALSDCTDKTPLQIQVREYIKNNYKGKYAIIKG